MYYKSILLPFAKAIGYTVLNKKAEDFHAAEDLLEMATLAIMKWINACFRRLPEDFNVIDWMHNIKNNRPLYELVYACYYYFVPYWITRAALKFNKVDEIKGLWRWWIHMFIAIGKRNYVVLSLRFLWIMQSLNPEVKKVYDQYRVFSFSGDEGTGIPWDGVVELVCIQYTIAD